MVSVTGSECWCKDSGRDGYCVEVGPVYAQLRGMRGSMSSICEADDSIKHVRLLDLLDQNTTCVHCRSNKGK